MIVESEYRGFRIEVNAVAERDRFNAEVRVLQLFSREKPHVEIVSCWKQAAVLAERAGAVYARRWVDSRLYSE